MVTTESFKTADAKSVVKTQQNAKLFHRYLSTHDKKGPLCQHKDSCGKRKSCGSECGCTDCLFHSSSSEGGALWRKVIENHSSQVYRWPPPAICTLCSLHFRLIVSKWSCFQLSHWMQEFIIKTLFSILLRNQVLKCERLILISMRRCETSTSAWKGNENVSWLWGKCTLMCEN